MKSPVVTVLMPFYNAERFIQEAVESILGQTFCNFELLAIDDGSSDASTEILRRKSDNRIRILVNDRNIGLIESLNRGIREARCELVARMDADDVSMSTRLAKQVTFMANHPNVALLGTFATFIDERGRSFHEGTVPTDTSALRVALIEGNCFVHTSVMFRRKPVMRVGGYRAVAEHAEDYDLWLRIASDHDVANIAEPLVRYRVHEEQVSLKKLKLQRQSANNARSKMLPVWRDKGWIPRRVQKDGGLRNRLVGGNTATGPDYIRWASLYAKMGNLHQARVLACQAVINSPLSSECWKGMVDIALTHVIGSEHRQVLYWYCRRVWTFLTAR